MKRLVLTLVALAAMSFAAVPAMADHNRPSGCYRGGPSYGYGSYNNYNYGYRGVPYYGGYQNYGQYGYGAYRGNVYSPYNYGPAGGVRVYTPGFSLRLGY